MANTLVLSEKDARMIRARHHFLVGLQDLQRVNDTIQAETGLAPLSDSVRAAQQIISDLDFAIFSTSEFSSDLPDRPWIAC
jgi:hypothetical protein